MYAQKIKIFDTTLRDGQQCPGAGMSFEENIQYAHLAAKAEVDILEVGFPAASQMDFAIVNTIAKEISSQENSPIIAALCQLRIAQLDITLKALEPAISQQKDRLHVYLPVDPELMHASLGSYANNYSRLIEETYAFIKNAASACTEVQFSPEGYSRMGKNFDFVTDLIRAAISAGATTINCPDTIGGGCQLQGEEYFVNKMQQHANIIRAEFPTKDITWSTHCHNDFGLALENTINNVFFGPATQIEGCFNGIGERAGNVALEQCIMYIKQFGDMAKDKPHFFTTVKSEMIQPISDFINQYMLPRQPHWPITGDNATRHTSGGHINAIIKNPMVYQPFDPKEIGKEISFVFGPLSGSNHAKAVLEKHGYTCAEHEKTIITQYIKDRFSDRRKGITDAELITAYLEYRQEYADTNTKNEEVIHEC